MRCPVTGCHDQDGQPRLLEDGPVCAPCRARGGRALAELPRIYVGLRTSDGAVTGDEKVSGTTANGTPINLHNRVLATRIHEHLTRFEDACRQLRHLTARPQRVREAWAVDHAVRLIQAHADVMWQHPFYGPELADKTLRLKARGWAALRWGSGRIELDLPCPHCELRTLYRFHGGADFVRCRHCGAYWDEDGYARLVAILAADQKAQRGTRP